MADYTLIKHTYEYYVSFWAKSILIEASKFYTVCVSILTETKLVTHLHCIYSTGRAVKESEPVQDSPIDLITSYTLNRKILFFFTLLLHYTVTSSKAAQTASKSFKTLFARSVCFPPLRPVWSKYPALISTHRSFARGLLNINYISIFSLTTRWLLICDLQTETGNY